MLTPKYTDQPSFIEMLQKFAIIKPSEVTSLTYSIAVFFDEKTEQELRRIWQLLANARLSDILYLSNNRPHITLSMYKNIDLEITSTALCTLASEYRQMDVSFRAVGIFPNTADVFLMPSVSLHILDLERKLREEFADISIQPDVPYFQPGEWTPHCSMAINVQRHLLLPAVQKVMEELAFPWEGKIVGLGLTSYPPVAHIQYCEFGE